MSLWPLLDEVVTVPYRDDDGEYPLSMDDSYDGNSHEMERMRMLLSAWLPRESCRHHHHHHHTHTINISL